MRVTIAERIRVDHELLASLIAAGFGGVEHHDVEVHVKARADRVVRWLLRCHPTAACGRPVNYRAGDEFGHCARSRRQALQLAGDAHAHHPPERLSVRPTYAFSGRAYPRLPDVARVAQGVRYLVTLNMPADPSATGDPYPRLSHYGRYKTAPAIVVAGWREELVHLAAHEARHTHQFRQGLSRSEIDAERWAHSRLAAWRAARGLPPPAIGCPPQGLGGSGVGQAQPAGLMTTRSLALSHAATRPIGAPPAAAARAGQQAPR